LEDVLEKKIIENLNYMYGKNNVEQTMMIFFLRAMIYHNKIDIHDNEYINFLIKELNMPENDIWIINGVEISRNSYLKPFSLANIMDCLVFNYLESFTTDEIGNMLSKREVLQKLFKRFKKTVDKKFKYERKGSLYYQERYRYCMLQELYKEFLLSVKAPKRIEGLEYPINHNDFELTIDEKYQRYYELYNKSNKKLTEEELETYIYCHPEVIGDIKSLQKQYKVQSGIIDLFGEDNNGNKIVIELKTKKRPKDLIWQLKAYTKDVKQIYGVKVRTIAITPPLDANIVLQLEEMNCELIYYYKRGNKIEFKKQNI
jgi:hypothetical protein